MARASRNSILVRVPTAWPLVDGVQKLEGDHPIEFGGREPDRRPPSRQYRCAAGSRSDRSAPVQQAHRRVAAEPQLAPVHARRRHLLHRQAKTDRHDRHHGVIGPARLSRLVHVQRLSELFDIDHEATTVGEPNHDFVVTLGCTEDLHPAQVCLGSSLSRCQHIIRIEVREHLARDAAESGVTREGTEHAVGQPSNRIWMVLHDRHSDRMLNG